ncbi:hypothetical protein AR437_06580 [Christensenella hongkongensis]|uniref:response regulator n=1 Tax=Christensenella hongkongensis TaxID=270498 RepID=UPI00073FF287|nr:response regulator [Christensenella hongkongensis]KUJ29785.1 hypothetical protein AR437_06580 [Christensenella hongkongensis]
MKIKIAIIEDEQAFVDSLGRLLRQWSETYKYLIDIKSYATGEAFLLAWEASEIFDVIFVDIMLPNSVNGIDLAKYIREKKSAGSYYFCNQRKGKYGGWLSRQRYAIFGQTRYVFGYRRVYE